MRESITIRELYEKTVEIVPSEKHSVELFKAKILTVLGQDPIRTHSLRKEIEQQGEDFEIHKNFPLNDFYYGIEKYIEEIWEDRILLWMGKFKEYVFREE